MMRHFRIAVLGFIALILSGCATVQDVATSKETVALCKAADVATTITALKTGAFHETNPIMNALMHGAHGFAPFILVSVAYVAVIWWIDNPTVNLVASGVTCGVAAHNAYIMVK